MTYTGRTQIWFDQSANAQRLNTPDGVARMVERCAEAGITDILLNVRNPGGLALYKSALVAHRSEVYDDYPAGYDLLDLTLNEAHRRGLKVHAAPDMFAGGYWNKQYPAFMSTKQPTWQSVVYGLDARTRQPITLPYSQFPEDALTAVPVDRTGVGFLNAGLPEVRRYLLDVLEELARNYPIDGFCLDRGRYNSLNVDFSPATRAALEAYVGEPIHPWPEAVYRVLPPGEEGGVALPGEAADPHGGVAPGTRCQPGPYFGAWLEYRARTIASFFTEARQTVKHIRQDLVFGDYTGSWYPLYWQVGVNWASDRYNPNLPWAGPRYAEAGYARQLDYLCTGCYYPEVTVAEARAQNAPADWYSVEGAANLSVEAVMGDTPVYGSLYLLQYKDQPAQYQAAVRMCRERTAGVMLFDLCYLDEYDWWAETRAALS
jgi:hypothetical protein